MAKIKVKGYVRKDGTKVASSDREVRGVWFEGRRTAIIVRAKKRSEAISKARAKLRRGGTAVKKVRQLNSSELRQAKRGAWVRSGPNGERAGYEGMRGQGPPVGGYFKKDKQK